MRASLRRLVYRAETLLQYRRFAGQPEPASGWPILLGISFPKSGTHLLDQILLGFSQVAPFSRRLHSFYAEYEGETGQKRAPEEALRWLDALRPRDVASAHLFARDEVLRRVTTSTFVPYFIYRDPRDVVVSHVFYVTDMERHHVHHDYYSSLPDFDARLRVSILGRPEAEVEFPNIADRFAPYMGWLDHPEVMTIHFEELVRDRPRALASITERLLSRVPLNVSEGTILKALENSINPARSPTFRSGKIGEWRKYFSAENKAVFKSVAGNLLLRLGYETSSDW